jgi:hypothetical protein
MTTEQISDRGVQAVADAQQVGERQIAVSSLNTANVGSV